MSRTWYHYACCVANIMHRDKGSSMWSHAQIPRENKRDPSLNFFCNFARKKKKDKL